MGYQVRLYAGSTWEFQGRTVLNTDVVVDLPRLNGGSLPQVLETLRGAGPPIGIGVDGGDYQERDCYGTPLTALDTEGLLEWLDHHHSDSRHLPAVAAARALLKRAARLRPPTRYVVVAYGH